MKKYFFIFEFLLVFLVTSSFLFLNETNNYQENVNSGQIKKLGSTDIFNLSVPWKR